MADETADVQARRDIAILQVQHATLDGSLKNIEGTLNKILLAIITGIGGMAGAALWTFFASIKHG